MLTILVAYFFGLVPLPKQTEVDVLGAHEASSIQCFLCVALGTLLDGTSRRTVVSDGRDNSIQSDWTGLLFFVSAVLLSTFILLFLLSSSVSLSYSILLFPCASVWENIRA